MASSRQNGNDSLPHYLDSDDLTETADTSTNNGGSHEYMNVPDDQELPSLTRATAPAAEVDAWQEQRLTRLASQRDKEHHIAEGAFQLGKVTDKDTRREMAYKQRFARAQAERNDKELRRLEGLHMMTLEQLEAEKAKEELLLQGAERMLAASSKSSRTGGRKEMELAVEDAKMALALIDDLVNDAWIDEDWSGASSPTSETDLQAVMTSTPARALPPHMRTETSVTSVPGTPESWKDMTNPALGTVATPQQEVRDRLYALVDVALRSGKVEDVEKLGQYAQELAEQRDDFRQQAKSLRHQVQVNQDREMDLANGDMSLVENALAEADEKLEQVLKDVALVQTQTKALKWDQPFPSDLEACTTDEVEKMRQDVLHAFQQQRTHHLEHHDHLKSTIHNLRESMQVTMTGMEDLAQRLQAKTEEAEGYSSELKRVRSSLIEGQESSNNLDDFYRKQNETLTTSLKASQEEAHVLRQELHANSQATARVAALEDEVADLQAKLRSTQAELEAQQLTVEELTTTSTTRTVDLETEVTTLKVSHQQQLLQLQQDLQTSEASRTEAEARVAALEAELAQLQQALKQSQLQLDTTQLSDRQLEAKHAQLAEQMSHKNTEFTTLQRDYAELQHSHTTLQDRLVNSATDFEEQTQLLSNAQAEIERLQVQLKSQATAATEHAQDDLARTTQQLNEEQARTADLTQDLSALESQLDEVKAQLSQVSDDLILKESSLEHHQSRAVELEQQLLQLRVSSFQQVEGSNSEHAAEISRLETEIKHQQAQIDALTESLADLQASKDKAIADLQAELAERAQPATPVTSPHKPRQLPSPSPHHHRELPSSPRAASPSRDHLAKAHAELRTEFASAGLSSAQMDRAIHLYETWLDAVVHLMGQDKLRAKDVFDRFDEDNDALLTRKEFGKCLPMLEKMPAIDTEDVKLLFRVLDRRHRKRIDLDDFAHHIKYKHQQSKYKVRPREAPSTPRVHIADVDESSVDGHASGLSGEALVEYLEDELKSVQSKLSHQASTIKRLEEEKDAAAANSTHYKTLYTNLQQDIDEVDRATEEQHAVMERLQVEQSSLQTSLDRSLSHEQHLDAQLEEQQAELAKLQAANTALQAQLQQAQLALSEANTANRQLQMDLEQAQEQESSADRRFQQAQAEASALTLRLDEVQGELLAVNSTMATSNDLEAQLRAELQANKRALADHAQQSESLSSERDRLEMGMLELESTRDALRSDLSKAEDDKARLQQELQELQASQSTSQQASVELETALSAANASVVEQQAQLDSLEQLLTTARLQMEQKDAEIRALKDSMSSLSTHDKDLEANLQQLHKSLSDKASEVVELQATNQRLENDIQRLVKAQEQLEADARAHTEARQQLGLQVTQLMEDLKAAQDAHNQTQKALTDTRERDMVDISTRESTVIELRSTLEEKTLALENQSAALEAAKAKIEKLEEQLSQVQMEYNQAYGNQKDLHLQIQDMNAHSQAYQHRREETERDLRRKVRDSETALRRLKLSADTNSASLSDTVKELNGKLIRVEESLSHVSKLLTDKTQELTDMQAEVQRRQLRVRELEDLVMSESQARDASSEEQEELTMALEHAAARASALEEDKTTIQHELARNQLQVQELEASVQSWQRAAEQAQNDVEQALAHAKRDADQNKLTMLAKQDETDRLRAQVGQLRTSVQSKEEQMLDLQQQIALATQQGSLNTTQLQREMTVLQQDRTRLEKEQSDTIARLESELQQERLASGARQQELISVQNKYQEQEIAFNNKVLEYKRHVQRLQLDLEQINQEDSALQAQSRRLTVEVRNLQQSLGTRDRELRERDEALATLRQQLEMGDEQSKVSNQLQVQKLKSEVQELERELGFQQANAHVLVALDDYRPVRQSINGQEAHVQELIVQRGDVLVAIGTEDADGYFEAWNQGEVGLVPKSFVLSVDQINDRALAMVYDPSAYDELKHRLEHASQSLHDVTDRLQGKEGALQREEVAREGLEQQVAASQATVDQLTRKLQEMQFATQRSADTEAAPGTFDRLNRTIESLSTQDMANQRIIETLRTQLQKMQEQVAEQQRQARTAQADSSNRGNLQAIQIDELQGRLSDATSSNQRLRREIEQLTARLQQVVEAEVGETRQVDQLTIQYRRLEDQHEQLKQAYTALDNRCQSVAGEAQRQRSQLEKAQQQNNMLSSELQASKVDLNSQRLERQHLQAHISSLTTEIKAATAAHRSDRELQGLSNQEEHLAHEVSRLHVSLEQEQRRYVQMHDQLQGRVQQLQEKLVDAESQLLQRAIGPTDGSSMAQVSVLQDKVASLTTALRLAQEQVAEVMSHHRAGSRTLYTNSARMQASQLYAELQTLQHVLATTSSAINTPHSRLVERIGRLEASSRRLQEQLTQEYHQVLAENQTIRGQTRAERGTNARLERRIRALEEQLTQRDGLAALKAEVQYYAERELNLLAQVDSLEGEAESLARDRADLLEATRRQLLACRKMRELVDDDQVLTSQEDLDDNRSLMPNVVRALVEDLNRNSRALAAALSKRHTAEGNWHTTVELQAQQIVALSENIDTTSALLRQSQRESASLRHELERLKAQHDEQEVADLRQENRALHRSLLDNDDHQKQMNSEVELLKADLGTAMSRLDSALRSSTNSATDQLRLRQVERENAELRSQLTAQQHENERLERVAAHARDVVAEAQNVRASVREQLAAPLRNAQRVQQALRNTSVTADVNLPRLQEYLDQSQDPLRQSQHEESMTALKLELQRYQKIFEELSSATNLQARVIEQLVEDKAALESKLSSVQTVLRASEARSSTAASPARSQRHDELSALLQRISDDTADASYLAGLAKAVSDEDPNLRRSLNAATTDEFDQQRRLIAEQASAIAALRKVVVDKTKATDDLKHQLESTQREQRRTLLQVESQQRGLVTRVQEYESELDHLQRSQGSEDTATLRRQLAEVRADLSDSQQRAHDYAVALDQQADELKHRQAIELELREELMQYQRSDEQLRQQQQSDQQDLDDLRSQLSSRGTQASHGTGASYPELMRTVRILRDERDAARRALATLPRTDQHGASTSTNGSVGSRPVHDNSKELERLRTRVRQYFLRYHRADSFRKSLTYQKQYLILLLGGFQKTEALTLQSIAEIKGSLFGLDQSIRNPCRGKARFRKVALAIIAAHRLQMLRARWQSAVQAEAL
eukprot:m.274530 g.274530  ORF g.274530 m.274530 type:complete len:3181 (+) comp17688_c0_seq1:170-9712(+)